jgi:hypothetical protein
MVMMVMAMYDLSKVRERTEEFHRGINFKFGYRTCIQNWAILSLPFGTGNSAVLATQQ